MGPARRLPYKRRHNVIEPTPKLRRAATWRRYRHGMDKASSAQIAHSSGERHLTVRLAASEQDVAAAQTLRFEIFHREMGAVLNPQAMACGRDVDGYDAVCDHLLVEDHARGAPQVVGTYRLLRQEIATPRGGFYSAGEFDLAPLIRHSEARGSRLLELGRSCVAREYRDSGTIQTLWRGIADYLAVHDIGYLFGCASFFGTDPDAHAAALTYLHHHHLAPPELRAVARGEGRVDLDRLPIGGYDPRLAMRALPPLIKAYLRVGACIGDGGWIDRDFNTIDVFMVMPVAAIAARYADRFAARNAA